MLDAGHAVLVEEYLDGPEVSLFALTDGTTVVPLVPAQDFKRRGRRRRRPQHRRHGRLRTAAVGPAGPGRRGAGHRAAADGRRDGAAAASPFSGLLYAGLALTSRGMRVVEFNARFGDPETQVVLPLLETPLAGLLHAAATGGLAAVPPLRWRDGAAVTVVVAAAGYPEAPRAGDPVTGADADGRAARRHRAWPPTARACPPAGGCSRSTAPGPTSPPPGRPPTSGSPGIGLEGAHWRTDIALAAVEGRISLRPAAA